jgi:hypothetical protein
VPDTIYFSPERSDRANVLAPLFQSPMVDRAADALVRLPSTILQRTGLAGDGSGIQPYVTLHVIGQGSPAPEQPVVLPMWAADP